MGRRPEVTLRLSVPQAELLLRLLDGESMTAGDPHVVRLCQRACDQLVPQLRAPPSEPRWRRG